MPEQHATLDLDAQDVTDASWEDLVQTMMEDELDAVTIQAGTICGCSCASCSCASCTSCGC
ncbi:hypothetical protein [Spirilliplanes yamanashiensis]|nr:hypothetical protein [Spirilliplanes yamanashiensis]MDP9820002.1 hypothetical protein [Spirilliplanes yamanashiensis]